ncbi:MAG: sortase [Candidatus Doudnabacteria bacterium]|nr:sortase [Candidatus Doudnabacteria bacterium]
MTEIFKNRLLAIVILASIFVLASFFQERGPVSDEVNAKAPSQQITQSKQENPKDQILFIPKLQVWVPIVYVEHEDALEMQTALTQGVAHLPNTSKPGEIGNAFILGYARNYPWLVSSYAQVFADLKQLEGGDFIAVIDQTGQLEFMVINIIATRAADFTVTNQETNGRRLLSLQAYYPFGEEDRYVVVAELTR